MISKFKLTEDFHLSISKQAFEADAKFSYEFDLTIPDTGFLGIDFGSFDGALVSLADRIDLKVNYNESDWENDGMEFTAGANAEILGLKVSGSVHLDVTVKDLEQIPGAIEHYIEGQVVDELKDKILGPLEEGVDFLKNEWNVAETDIINAMVEAGHVRTPFSPPQTIKS